MLAFRIQLVVLRLLTFVALISVVFGSSFVGISKNIDTVSYGTLSSKSGQGSILASFKGLVTFNAPQFAYSSTTNLYSFIAYDSSSFASSVLSLNASDGYVVYNVSFASPPLPFGLAYDIQGVVLYGQVWYANGSMALAALNPRTLALTTPTFTWQPGDWWTYVDSVYCDWNNTYYSLFLSPAVETLVGINVLTGHVTLNVSLVLDTTLGVATGLRYNNVTNSFYVVGFNNVTQNYDIASINPATGSLTYLNVFTNSTLGTVQGLGLDSVNDVLDIVYTTGYQDFLVIIDLKRKIILSTTKLAPSSIDSMLVLI